MTTTTTNICFIAIFVLVSLSSRSSNTRSGNSLIIISQVEASGSSSVSTSSQVSHSSSAKSSTAPSSSSSSSSNAPGSTTSSGSTTASGGSGPTPTPTPTPTTTTGIPTPDPNVTQTDTQPPQTFTTKQTIEWYIVVVAIGIVFILIGASCYVTLMWQQKALRDYKAQFEELLKERGMQKRKLEEEVKEREEAAYSTGNVPPGEGEGLDALEAPLNPGSGDAQTGPRGGPGGGPVLVPPPIQQQPQRSSKYDIVSEQQRKKDEEIAQAQAALLMPKRMEREKINEARRGPMMVRRNGESQIAIGGAMTMDVDHNRRANDLLTQMKEKDRKKVVDERQGGSIEKGLNFTYGAHQNLQTLKSSSQLRNIASLSQ